MHFKDRLTTFHVWLVNRYLAVKSSRTKQCRIQNIGSISSCKNDDSTFSAESVHFNQQLVECAFSLIIAHNGVLASCAANGINLIDKYDTRRFFSCLLEQIANTT